MRITSDRWNVSMSAERIRSVEAVRDIAEEVGLFLPTAGILYDRGYRTPDEVKRFLSKETEMFHDPFLMKDMKLGAERILSAAEKHEKTVVYGDYDVDGVTSVSILYMYLREIGCDVGYYIPSRSAEGYGMSAERVRELAAEGVTLIVTVDTGITAVDEAKTAKECGIDLVVTDHHECHGELPEAYAVINPRRQDCPYPFKELAGVGVAFKFICAAHMLSHPEKSAIDCVIEISRKHLDLVAIGTVADVMPIVDENRLIVAQGLRMLEKTPRQAIVQLMNAINSDPRRSPPKHMTSNYIGYTIAPRINAAGRIASASIAVDMFLSEDKTQTASLARKLCDINRDRQAEENKIAESASEKIEESYDLSDCPMIILDDEKWHHGIIGIVSSRITEKYQLPSILISFEGNKGEISDEDIGKGSGRSVKGLNLVEALSSCRDILEKFGGHELAAGLTVKRKNLPELRRRLEAYARAYINSDTAENVLSADAELLPEDVTLEQAEQVSQLEPYGPGNTMPLLVIRDLAVSDIVSVGEGKHTKLTLDCGGRPVTAMCFRSTLEELDIYPGDHVDVAFNIDVNEYQNTKSVQMIVREISSSETVLRKRSGDRERLRHITETVRAGEKTEDVTIDRKDVAAVYTMIKNELKMHHEVFSIHALLHLSSANRIDTDYIRMSLILRIFFELGFLGIKMPADSREIYRFSSELPDRKTSLEKSEIYRAVSHD